MQRVDQRVTAGYFATPAPRAIPPDTLPDLLLDHVVRPGLRALLDPGAALGLAALLALALAGGPWYLRWLALALVAARVWGPLSSACGRMRDELALLRHGVALHAHILRMAPTRAQLEGLSGADLDCAIVVAPRRTYIGRVWLSDGAEAVALTQRGRMLVLCLPRAPGTWRVIEPLQSEVRYDHKSPLVQIPSDA